MQAEFLMLVAVVIVKIEPAGDTNVSCKCGRLSVGTTVQVEETNHSCSSDRLILL